MKIVYPIAFCFVAFLLCLAAFLVRFDASAMKTYVNGFAHQNGVEISGTKCAMSNNGRSRKGVCWVTADQSVVDKIIKSAGFKTYGKKHPLDNAYVLYMLIDPNACLNKSWIKSPDFTNNNLSGRLKTKTLPWRESVIAYEPSDKLLHKGGVNMNSMFFDRKTNQVCFDLQFPYG